MPKKQKSWIFDVSTAGTYMERKNHHRWLAASKQLDSDTKIVEDTQLCQRSPTCGSSTSRGRERARHSVTAFFRTDKQHHQDLTRGCTQQNALFPMEDMLHRYCHSAC